MTDTDNAAQVIKQLAMSNATAEPLEPGVIYGYRTQDGPRLVDLTGDEYLEFPRRKQGTVTVDNVASFAQYYGKHSDEDSEVFADLASTSVTAVLDAHCGTGAAWPVRWQEHRLVLQLDVTPEWRDWSAANGHMRPQTAFAEFVEDHIGDINPEGPCTGSDLLEMAQQFHATNKVQFASASRLSSGETQFQFAETIEAKAGQRGQITIPGAFELAIRVFEDLDPYKVKARFRYRIDGGQLTLGYRLNDPERIVRDAVDLVIAKAQEACNVTIMLGRP